METHGSDVDILCLKGPSCHRANAAKSSLLNLMGAVSECILKIKGCIDLVISLFFRSGLFSFAQEAEYLNPI